MKSYIDFFETYKGEFLSAKRFRNRFIRRWGTETIDGVKVMKKRFIVYPGHLAKDSNGDYTENAKNIQNMCKMLGSWSEVKDADFGSVAGFYFHLNPNKNDTTELAKELLAEKIDLFCPQDEWQEFTVNYIDTTDPAKFDGWSKEQILAYIDNDYANIFSSGNGFIIEDDIDKLAIGQYVLFDDGTEFEVKVVNASVTTISNTFVKSSLSSTGKNIYSTGLNVVIRYKRIVAGIDPDGPIITAILSEEDADNISKVQELQRSSLDVVSGSIVSETDLLSDVLWYKGQLRYSTLTTPGISAKIINVGFLKFLDSGTIKKKVKWYKKLLIDWLSINLIIGAIIIATLTGQWWLVAVAAGIVQGLQMITAKHWGSEYGEYMGRWVKIASIASIVTGIGSVIANVAKQAAAQSIVQSAAAAAPTATAQVATTTLTDAAAQVAKMTFTETLQAITFDGLMSAAGDMLISSWKSMAMKVVGKAIEMRQAAMNADLAGLTAQEEDTAEALAEMTDRNMDIGVEDIKWFTDLSSQANARYDFNSPYEAEAATIHVGNICRASFYNGARLNLRAEGLA